MPSDQAAPRPDARHRHRRIVYGSFGTAFAALIGLVVYAVWIAPYDVELTRYPVRMRVGAPLRVLQISDLHSKGPGRREQMVLELVKGARPDLIVITGDSVTAGAPCEAARATLDALEAPLGVWMVPGNWEYWQAEVQGEQCICPSNKVRCLHNEAVQVRDDLWLVGVDDALTGSASVPQALRGVPDSADLLVIAHEPTVADELRRSAVVLSGHTHGGQICLPFIGALIVPPGSGNYVSGWYHRDEVRLFVSRGIGTSILPARLICGPEVTVFEIGPGEG